MEQGTKRGDYYLGLDMGTDSVGWAVTDMDYRIPKFKGNAMWGVRLFDESNTAEERRLFRISRRRTQRRRERLDLLEMLFDGPVSTKDPAFFQRLRESDLYAEDKTTNTPFAVFADPDYTDTDYHRQFPTIYHLRNALLHEDGPYDVRLVFLAVHHIIKNRGHFLFDSLGEAQNFGSIYGAFRDYLQEEYECAVECTDEKAFGAVLKDKSLSKSRKTAAAAELFGVTKKERSPVVCLPGTGLRRYGEAEGPV
jgi:CRISPR-associated endonuclease Csn1